MQPSLVLCDSRALSPPPTWRPAVPSDLPSGWSPCFLLRGQQRSVSGTHALLFAPGELKERGKKAPTKHAPQTKRKWRRARHSETPGRGGASGLARVPGRGVMRTDRPATPGLSPHLDAGRVAAPPRARAPPPLSRSLPAPEGHLAPHGAEGLAADRVLLLPVQVPGGARRAREGAPGQVGARLALVGVPAPPLGVAEWDICVLV